jgi:hypothetical protein
MEKFASEYGIAQQFTLPGGTVVSFRKKPYNIDLDDLLRVTLPIKREQALLVPDRRRPGEYRKETLNISRLFNRDGRGMASATDEVKSSWDAQSQRMHTPRSTDDADDDIAEPTFYGQKAFNFNGPAKPVGKGDIWADFGATVRARQEAGAALHGFLKGKRPKMD